MMRPLMVTLVLLLAGTASGQWLGYPAKNIPRNPDGTPNLSAPVPRTAAGRPDLSGVWQPTTDPRDTAGGIEGIVAPKYQVNVMRDLKAVPFQPWAKELFERRQANKMRDNR